MERRSFIKVAGTIVIGVPFAKKILTEEPPGVYDGVVGVNPLDRDGMILYRAYGDRDIAEVIRIYKETGDLVYRANMVNLI